jgi:ATP-binding protein involved in chromosome partitioning
VSSISESAVRNVLDRFQDPETGRSIVQLQQVHRLDLGEGRISVTLGLTTWSAPLADETRESLAARLRQEFPAAEVAVELAEHPRPAEKRGPLGVPAKSVIAVGSGKGGVGKSSVAALLAAALARWGAKVGLLDADLYGPSLPHLLGTAEPPGMSGDRIQPVEVAGLKLLSIGLLIPPGEAVIWRGPMLHSALTQFLRDTAWDDVDYLIIDMPPGTGDVAISLAQLLPMTGAVIVCTPQDVALLDATKAIAMFRKLGIPLLGMVENMSFFLCPNCHARHDIFGTGGARRRAAELDVAFLGEVPLETHLRILADEGRIAAALDNPPARPYLEGFARQLIRNLADEHCRHPRRPSLPVLNN